MGETGVEVGDVGFFYGAGGDGFVVCGGQGGGEVLDEEWHVAAVFDVEVDEEVEGVVDGVAAYDERFGFEDDVGGVGGDVLDGDVGGGVGGVVEQDGECYAQDGQGDEDGDGEVAARGRGEGKGHWYKVLGTGCEVQGKSLRALDCVFLEEDYDEGGGGDRDHGSYNAGEGCADEEGDENGEAHEVDAAAHDAGREDGALEVGVEGVEGEDGSHLGP